MKKVINQGRILAAILGALGSIPAMANLDAVPGEFVVKMKPGAMHSLSAIAALKTDRLDEETFLVKGSTLPSLRANKAVEKAEPNYLYRSLSALDWSLENSGQADCGGAQGTAGIDVKANDAWKITKGSEQVIVAVIDTGVEISSPRLRDKIQVNQAEAGGQPGVDDDRNGFIDDTYGFDFVSESGITADENGHGTFCAGAIASALTENDGVAGLSPNVKILPVRFLNSAGEGTLANAIKAIDYSVSRGAKVLSNSWGGGQHSALLEESIQRAKEAGVVFVAAAGNNGSSNDRYAVYPASYALSNVIAVTAVDNKGQLPYFANTGSSVHIAAPGVNMLGLQRDGTTTCASGTSMAAPLVAAAAGLMLSQNPALSPEAVKEKIIRSATPLPALAGKVASGGMLNAYGALLGL